MVRVEPAGKTAVGLSELSQPPGVFDNSVDLSSMANDRRAAEQPLTLTRPKPSDPLEVVVGKGLGQRRPLAQNGKPGKAGLVDLEH